MARQDPEAGKHPITETHNAVLTGLTSQEAARRLAADGPNELPTAKKRNLLQQAWDVVREPMLLLLVGAGCVNFLLSEPLDGVILMSFVVVVIAISIYQEHKTENALAALRDLSSPRALVVAYVITRAATWVSDLRQGRVELILAGPVSWPRLIGERLTALVAEILVITAGSIAGLVLAATSAGAPLSGAGLLRLTAITVLLGTTLGAVAAVAVAWLPSGLAVTVLAVFATASYLLTYLVQLFGWPGWVSKLSVFGAFSHPYLELPTAAGFAVLAGLAMGGTLLAAAVARRSPKAA